MQYLKSEPHIHENVIEITPINLAITDTEHMVTALKVGHSATQVTSVTTTVQLVWW